MKLWKYCAAVVGIFLVLLLGYGTLIEPRLILDEQHHTTAIPELGEEWEGTKVAFLADIQVGMWWTNTGMAEKAVERIVEEEPDVILLGGDFVYGDDPSTVDDAMAILQPIIDSGITTVAVLGNHDYEAEAEEELTTAFESAGISVLLNEALALSEPGASAADQLHVVGIGPARPGLDDVETALADLPESAPRVVLMHNPRTYTQLPGGSAPLSMAGHTHCGQIALPGTKDWSWMQMTKDEQVVADGFAPPEHGEPGNRMFVTCGIGFSLVPVRIAAPPQIVFFELTAAE
ncbi:metallophosphoesterase [Nesterenkonia sp. CF4.4]|uniref:metallophosphoesterase n=1 Tax=Nesterenkonia sp. CF4.4 TaxID=3373079 RepID=UPI003EE7D916